MEQPKPDKQDETNSDENDSTTTLKIPKESEGQDFHPDVPAKAPFAYQSSNDSYNKSKDKESKSKDSDSKTIDKGSKSHDADEDEKVADEKSIDDVGNKKNVTDGTPGVALKSHDTEKDKKDTDSRVNEAADSKDNLFNSSRNISHSKNMTIDTGSKSHDADEDKMVADEKSIDDVGNKRKVTDGTPGVALKGQDTEKEANLFLSVSCPCMNLDEQIGLATHKKKISFPIRNLSVIV